jgi:hypothetical protein
LNKGTERIVATDVSVWRMPERVAFHAFIEIRSRVRLLFFPRRASRGSGGVLSGKIAGNFSIFLGIPMASLPRCLNATEMRQRNVQTRAEKLHARGAAMEKSARAGSSEEHPRNFQTEVFERVSPWRRNFYRPR